MPFPMRDTKHRPTSPRRQSSSDMNGGGCGGSHNTSNGSTLSAFPLSLFRSASAQAAAVVGRSTASLSTGQTAKERAENEEQCSGLLKGGTIQFEMKAGSVNNCWQRVLLLMSCRPSLSCVALFARLITVKSVLAQRRSCKRK